jgi:hypothetical protein
MSFLANLVQGVVGAVTTILKPPKSPIVQPPAPAPSRGDPAIAEAAERERRRILAASGLSSTVLTGGQLGAAPVQKSTVLGGP